jgi:hypothetical protein
VLDTERLAQLIEVVLSGWLAVLEAGQAVRKLLPLSVKSLVILIGDALCRAFGKSLAEAAVLLGLLWQYRPTLSTPT